MELHWQSLIIKKPNSKWQVALFGSNVVRGSPNFSRNRRGGRSDFANRSGFLIIKDCQCGSASFVHPNCIISIFVYFYVNFIHKTKCKLNTEWVNEHSLTKTYLKSTILLNPSSSTQSSPFMVFWDKTKGIARIVIGTSPNIVRNH